MWTMITKRAEFLKKLNYKIHKATEKKKSYKIVFFIVCNLQTLAPSQVKILEMTHMLIIQHIFKIFRRSKIQQRDLFTIKEEELTHSDTKKRKFTHSAIVQI